MPYWHPRKVLPQAQVRRRWRREKVLSWIQCISITIWSININRKYPWPIKFVSIRSSSFIGCGYYLLTLINWLKWLFVQVSQKDPIPILIPHSMSHVVGVPNGHKIQLFIHYGIYIFREKQKSWKGPVPTAW